MEPTNTTTTGTGASATPAATAETETHLDGNAAGGQLRTIFAVEMTTVVSVCAGCGANNPLGAVRAYMSDMGTVLRCPTCDTALIRMTHIRDEHYVDMAGTLLLRIREAPAETGQQAAG